jgi:hypothetical protein
LPAPRRDIAGASFRAAARFLRPPLSSRTAGFPQSGWKRRPVCVEPSRPAPRLKRWRAYAACGVVCSLPRPIGVLTVFRAQSLGRSLLTEPPSPRAPSLQRRYLPSALLRAHAQIPAPPIFLSRICLMEGVLAACATHGWSRGPSRFGSALLSWSATPSTPAARRVLLTSSSPTTSAFASYCQARLTASSPAKRLHAGHVFRRGRHSLMLRPSRLLALLAVRHRNRAAPQDVVHSSFPSIRCLLDSRICYPADWSIAGAGLAPARRAAVLGCTSRNHGYP